MRNGTRIRLPDALGIFRQQPRDVTRRWRDPRRAAAPKFGIIDQHIDAARIRIDAHAVAILQ
jgi:hypothetical protein